MAGRLGLIRSAFLVLCGLAWDTASGQSKFDASGARDRGATALLGDSNWSSWQSNAFLYGGAAQPQSWRLGLRVDNSDVGAVVRDVTPGGAANRARLEVGDLIVSVGGYQVGMIDGRLYDLGEELNRRADQAGAVSLLVQDHRTGQLATIRVQLDASQSVLSGDLLYRERFPLPSDALVTVQVDNVTRPYAAVRGGQVTFRPQPGSTIPFEIPYDATYVSASDIYQVRAYVTSGGRTILETQPARVLTQGNPVRVTLQLASSPVQYASGGSSVVTAGYPNYNALDEQLSQLYSQYLGRLPTNLELAALRASPNIATRISSLPIELMAAQEFFDAAGNTNQLWLNKVFTIIVGRTPTQREFDDWMRRYADLRYSRTQLLQQLYSQVGR